MKGARDQFQTVQRLKVGLIGLAAVVLLIGLASAIIGSATTVSGRETSGSGANVNLLVANEQAHGEPLAELGAAPGPANDQAIATR